MNGKNWCTYVHEGEIKNWKSYKSFGSLKDWGQELWRSAGKDLANSVIENNHWGQTLSFDPNHAIFPKANLKFHVLGNEFKLILNQTMFVPRGCDFHSTLQLP